MAVYEKVLSSSLVYKLERYLDHTKDPMPEVLGCMAEVLVKHGITSSAPTSYIVTDVIKRDDDYDIVVNLTDMPHVHKGSIYTRGSFDILRGRVLVFKRGMHIPMKSPSGKVVHSPPTMLATQLLNQTGVRNLLQALPAELKGELNKYMPQVMGHVAVDIDGLSQWVDTYSVTEVEACKYAARNGYMSMLQAFDHKRYLMLRSVFDAAIEGDQVECLKYLHDKHRFQYDRHAIKKVARYDSINCFKYMLSAHKDVITMFADRILKAKYEDSPKCIIYYLERINWSKIAQNILEECDFNTSVLTYLLSNGFNAGVDTVAACAKYTDNVEAMKLLLDAVNMSKHRSNKKSIMKGAIDAQNRKIISLLAELNWEWDIEDEDVAFAIGQYGSIELVSKVAQDLVAVDVGSEVHTRLMKGCIYGGREACLKVVTEHTPASMLDADDMREIFDDAVEHQQEGCTKLLAEAYGDLISPPDQIFKVLSTANISAIKVSYVRYLIDDLKMKLPTVMPSKYALLPYDTFVYLYEKGCKPESIESMMSDYAPYNIVKYMVDHGYEVDKEAPYSAYDLDIMKLLLERGAPIKGMASNAVEAMNFGINAYSCLVYALEHGDTDIEDVIKGLYILINTNVAHLLACVSYMYSKGHDLSLLYKRILRRELPYSDVCMCAIKFGLLNGIIHAGDVPEKGRVVVDNVERMHDIV